MTRPWPIQSSTDGSFPFIQLKTCKMVFVWSGISFYTSSLHFDWAWMRGLFLNKSYINKGNVVKITQCNSWSFNSIFLISPIARASLKRLGTYVELWLMILEYFLTHIGTGSIKWQKCMQKCFFMAPIMFGVSFFSLSFMYKDVYIFICMYS